MDREFTIDGSRFATLDEFYDQVGAVLAPRSEWGHNLEAFNDILSWQCFDQQEPDVLKPYVLIWRNAALSRNLLGYEETARWLRAKVNNCHPSNRQRFIERLEAAMRKEGQTLFDMLVEIICENSAYVELVLE